MAATPTYDLILELFRVFDQKTDSVERHRYKQDIIGHIHLLAEAERDALIYYIWGMVCYLAPPFSEESTLDALDKFKTAVAKNGSLNMAHLYCGQCYLDLQLYQKALEAYTRVDAIKLQRDFPLWRYVKWREQLGYCRYQLGQTHTAETVFTEVLGWYQRKGAAELAHPSEMLSVLPVDHPIRQDMMALIAKH